MSTKKDIYNKINLLIEIMNNNNSTPYSMTSKNEKWNSIMKDYHKKVILYFDENATTPYSRYNLDCSKTGSIYFTKSTFDNPDERDLFDLLHEIGHIMTNRKGMKRCTEEFLATQWALDNAKKYNVKVTIELINDFQCYIYYWRDYAIKRNAKIVPSKEELKLKYKF